jgi:hypothetical protein
MNKTEAQLIESAVRGSFVFLTPRKAKTLVALLDIIGSLYVTKIERQSNCVKLAFDPVIRLGRPPEDHLTQSEILQIGSN